MDELRGTDGPPAERFDERVRNALELATGDLLRETETAPSAAFDAALVGVFRALVSKFAAERGRDEPPFAQGNELEERRHRFESLSPEATTRLESTVGKIEYERLTTRQLGGVYERLLDCEPDVSDGEVQLTEDATQRASVGAYYTPENVVEYAVSQAIDGNPEATVLDPAMGSGHFLTCAIDQLAELRGDQSEEVRKKVAENCVFGVDIDPLAVELARSSVWLETGFWPVENLRVGDSLAETTNWPKLGQFVTEKRQRSGGNRRFDAVVGNPPYVRSRHISEGRKKALKSRFDTVTGAFDLYVPFVERMAKLGGRVSCVVPNKWTTARYGRTLRDHLLDRHRLVELLDVSDVSVFADASVYPLVVTVESGSGPTETIRVRQGEAVGTGGIETEGIETAVETRLSRSFVDELGDRVIPVGIDPAFVSIAERLRHENDELGSHVSQTEGIHTGNVRDKLVVDDPGPDCERLVSGGNVSRYGVEWDGDWIRFDRSLIGDDEYGSLRDRKVFEDDKLLLRDISERPVAAYDDEGLYALNTLYSVRSESDLPLRYLLAVINSTVATCWFQQVYGGTHVSGGYLRFKPMFARRLPIPAEVGESERKTVVALATRMCDLRRERKGIEIRLPEANGQQLGELARRLRTDSVLFETSETRDGLRLGTVSVAENGTEGKNRELVISATARYRPEDGRGNSPDEEEETDSWGFTETDPIPVLVVEGNAEWRELLEWYVPRATASERFTTRAMKTISPLDRLESLRVPEPEDAREFVETNRRVEELERKIARTDAAIDRLVYRAYGLSVEEVETVEQSVR
ncbi:N-6 DNA Methylase [Haladaptatus litoreus]|uniref:site-specific DNA-methyltransferase (adenine-specific) n=1 Tax=Haladaptatus litoreus TaxID=553468 RepID=A0A1N7DWR7_9EURY|nr:TaqI-like C-terminal specificity domain-containing protein [Haladaptatus litoreus]SIR80221.1 N-6 DNA Methylase [Haladaptatus litoreus]